MDDQLDNHVVMYIARVLYPLGIKPPKDLHHRYRNLYSSLQRQYGYVIRRRK